MFWFFCGFVRRSSFDQNASNGYAPTSKRKCRHNQFSYYYFFCVKCVITIFILLFHLIFLLSIFFLRHHFADAAAVGWCCCWCCVGKNYSGEKRACDVNFLPFFLLWRFFFSFVVRRTSSRALWSQEGASAARQLNDHRDEVRKVFFCAARIEEEIYYPICKWKENKGGGEIL